MEMIGLKKSFELRDRDMPSTGLGNTLHVMHISYDEKMCGNKQAHMGFYKYKK